MTRFENVTRICGGLGLPEGGCAADGLAAGLFVSDFTASGAVSSPAANGSETAPASAGTLAMPLQLDKALSALDLPEYIIFPGFCKSCLSSRWYSYAVLFNRVSNSRVERSVYSKSIDGNGSILQRFTMRKDIN